MRIRDGVSACAGAGAVAVAIFAVGGVFRWTQAIVAALVVLALVPAVLSRRDSSRLSPLLALLGTAFILTGLQLVPLPASLLAQLQPIGAGLREDGATLIDLEPSHALTLDEPGSLRALAFFAILFGVAWISLRLAVTERGRYRILAVVGGLCGLTAVVVGIHVITGAKSLYGLYTPEQANPSVLGPLLNENHLGGLMAVGTLLTLGLAMYPRQHSRLRVLWLLASLACATTVLGSQSRGATLAVLAGLLITGALLVGQRVLGTETSPRRRRLLTSNSLPIGIVAISAIVVIIYASAGGVSAQLERTNFEEIHQPLSKFAIWSSTAQLIDESPWVGIGRGAFEPAFTRVHPSAAVHSFSHVENEYLQALVEWGIPGTILLGLATVWLIVTGVRRWRDGPLIAGAIGAVVAIGLQSIVDFGIEMLGVAVPVTVVLATIAYTPVREVTGRRLVLFRGAVVAQCLALAAGIALLLSSATRTVAEDHDEITALAAPTLSDLVPSIERHPLDYYGYAVAAQTMMRTGDPSSVRLLNHALRLHPTHPGLHQLAARMLYRAGRPEQAALEYALALEHSTTPRALLGEVVGRFPPELAATAIPKDYPDLEGVAQQLLDQGHGDILDHWLIRVLEAHPGNVEACEWLYTVSLRSGDLAAAEAAGQRCVSTAPTDERRVQLARLFLTKQRPGDAEQLLRDVEAWTGRVDVKLEGWLALCDALEAKVVPDEAKRCLRRLDAIGIVPQERQSEISVRMERIEAALRSSTKP